MYLIAAPPCPLSITGKELRSCEKTAEIAETAPFISESENNVGNDIETEAKEINEENSDHDRVEEEPKPGMKFATDHELMAYYM